MAGIDINAEIVPATSIGGVSIGSQLQDVITSLNNKDITFEKREFTNFGAKYVQVFSEQYGVTIVGESNGRIVRVSCIAPYRGKFGECFPGMTVAELRQVTSKQLVIHGLIVPDSEYGIVFDIPEVFAGQQFDDIDHIGQLPQHMPLNEIHVQDQEWWR